MVEVYFGLTILQDQIIYSTHLLRSFTVEVALIFTRDSDLDFNILVVKSVEV